VLVLAPKIGHASMNSGDTAFRLLPVASVFLLPGDRTLRTSKLRKFSLEVSRVLDLFSVRERGEVSQPDVDSDCGKDVPNWSGFTNIRSHYQKPLIRLSLQGKRLDLPLNFAVQTDADLADVLNSQPVSFEPDSVPVTRKEYRVETIGAFESRVTGFLAGFDAPKEIGERFIKSPKSSLGTAEVDRGKPAVILTFVFEPAGLIFVTARNLPFVVEPLALPQSRVEKPSVGFKHDPKFALLVRVGPKAEFIGAEHPSFPLLAFNVFTNRVLTDVTDASCVVTPGPKRREPAAQEAEFLSQDAAGVTFEPIGDLRDRKRWVTLQKQVNVIGPDFYCVNGQRKLIRLFQQQRFQALGGCSPEDTPQAIPTALSVIRFSLLVTKRERR
jgi:hypothetical protein